MKASKPVLARLLSLALVLLLALTAAVPAFAVNDSANKENLKITIHNNKGLPEMRNDQFGIYQLFKGTPQKQGDAVGADWDATNWNNYILADIEWGESIKDKDTQDKLLAALKGLDPADTDWLDDALPNPFASVTTAAELAEVLKDHTDNAFMQGFADFLMTGNAGGSFLTDLGLTGELTGSGENQTLTYDLKSHGTGYYIFQDKNSPSDPTTKAVSEYIVAVMGSQDIDLKASVPTVEKWIDAVGTTAGGKKGTTADIGEDVKFVLQGNLPKNYDDFASYKYVFHDTMSTGLSYLSDPAPSITISDSTGKSFTVNVADYTVKTTGIDDTPCNLEFVFENLKNLENSTIPGGFAWDELTKITVTYYGELNENAVIGAGAAPTYQGNPNTVQLEYSNDPHELDKTAETEVDTVRVYTFGLDLHKNGVGDTDKDGLPGAGFTLQDASGNYAKFKEEADGKRVFDSWVSETTVKDLIDAYNKAKKAWDEMQPDAQAAPSPEKTELDTAIEKLQPYVLTSKEDPRGELPEVVGLDDETYTLKEVITPAGYNTMKSFEVDIKATVPAATGSLDSFTYTPNKEAGSATTYSSASGQDIYQSGLIPQTLTNTKGPVLPFTGGIGTLIFYVLGAALIVGAITYLVIASKKRNKAEETA